MVDAIIFDMDGTLIDTLKATSGALMHCAPKYGLLPCPDDDIRAAMGLADAEFFRMLYPEANAATIEALCPEVEAHENAIMAQIGKGMLFPGVESLLNALYEQKKIMILASTGSVLHVSSALGSAGISHLFQEIHANQPDKVDMLADIIRRHPHHTFIMVGDMQKDSHAAHENGILAYGAGYGYCTPDRQPMFDTVLSTPDELLLYI